jgi:hypothetical protein
MIIKIEIQIDTENRNDVEKMQELYRIVEDLEQSSNEGYQYDDES